LKKARIAFFNSRTGRALTARFAIVHDDDDQEAGMRASAR